MVTALTDSVSLHSEPSVFMPVTTVGTIVTIELTMALHEHAVEYSCGPGGPSPIGAKPLRVTSHIAGLVPVPYPEPPNPLEPGVMVEFAAYFGNDPLG